MMTSRFPQKLKPTVALRRLQAKDIVHALAFPGNMLFRFATTASKHTLSRRRWPYVEHPSQEAAQGLLQYHRLRTQNEHIFLVLTYLQGELVAILFTF